MAVKSYQSTSSLFRIVATQETKQADSTGHTGKAKIIPGMVIQFVAGRYSTADAGEQSLLDAKVTDPRSGIS